MKTIPATQFKAQCLQLMKQVRESGQPVVVTNRGEPLVTVSPVVQSKPRFQIGKFDGSIEIVGDIIAPIDVEWEAMK